MLLMRLKMGIRKLGERKTILLMMLFHEVFKWFRTHLMKRQATHQRQSDSELRLSVNKLDARCNVLLELLFKTKRVANRSERQL